MYCGRAKHERDALHCSSYCFCYKTQRRLCSSTVAIRALPTKPMALKEYGWPALKQFGLAVALQNGPDGFKACRVALKLAGWL